MPGVLVEAAWHWVRISIEEQREAGSRNTGATTHLLSDESLHRCRPVLPEETTEVYQEQAATLPGDSGGNKGRKC